MDRKSLLILAGAMLVLFILFPAVDHFFPPQPVPPSVLAAMTNQAAGTNREIIPTSGGTNTATAGAPTATPTHAENPRPEEPEKILTVTNATTVFHFTSRGGGIKSVALKDYKAVVARSSAVAGESNFVKLNWQAPAPILAVVGSGELEDDNFTLTESNGIVHAERLLPGGLRVVKEFDVRETGTNYLFTARVRLENTLDTKLIVPARDVMIGTATPIGPLDDPSTLGTLWYNGAKATDIGASWFANPTFGCFPGTPRSEFDGIATNVVWAATHNQFFALAVIPSKPAGDLTIHPVRLPSPDSAGVASPNAATNAARLTNGYQAAFRYPAVVLDGHKSLEQSFTIYAGPKKYKELAEIGQSMGNNLDLVMGFTGYMGMGFFAKVSEGMLLCMNGLHAIGLHYGLTIIAITVVLKLVFWPLTAATTRSQKRMQALQPQMAAIAEKYKDDPLKKHEKTTEFMREHKINPLGSCLPMLIQIPVFIGFYSMLRNAIELRGIHFLWAADLSQPDTVTWIAGVPINPLPLIMGVTQIWQAHLTPSAPGMDPSQQKLMRWMPLMFIMVFYKMSAGLTLYWTVSTLLTIVQTKITRLAAVDAGPAVVAKKKK